MKNLTRVLALVLVFSMMVSSVAFAAKFTDVEDGSTYAEATDVLSALGIVNGDPEGTFRPNDDITRAEVVAIANRLQGLSEAAKAAGGVTAYTDVAADAWYAGDVNLATQMGIVSGDGDGTFRPQDNVKYEEAVKIMVTALGYDAKYADKQGGWPTGYLVIANNAGVTSGVSATTGTYASRGIVAKLAYNALTAPMMAFKQYSDSGEAIYAPQKAKTLLGEKLGFVKIDGVVAATSVTSVTGVAVPEDGEVKVEYALDTAADGTNGTYYKYLVGKTELLDLNGVERLEVGATNVASALGYTTSVYVGENEDGDNEVLAFVLNAKKNEVVELDPEFIMATNAQKYPSLFNSTAPYLSVYDEDNDTTNKEYTLETDASIIVNNKYYSDITFVRTPAVVDDQGTIKTPATYYTENMYSIQGAVADLGLVYAPNNGTVKLLDADNNGKYDYIFVTSYEAVIVDEVYAQGKKISTKFSGTIDLTGAVEGKEDYSYSLTKDGVEIAITDLKEYDILSIAATDNLRHMDILVSDKKVTGSVQSVYNTPNDVDDHIYTIGDEEYSIANFTGRAGQVGSSVTGLTPGDEGTALVDAFGNIVYFEKTSAVSGNFGFIMAAGNYESMGKTNYEVQILNKDGSISTFDLAEKVDVAFGAATATEKTKAQAYADIANDGSWVDTDNDGQVDTFVPGTMLYENAAATTKAWAFNSKATVLDGQGQVVTASTKYYDENGTVIYDADNNDLLILTEIYANRIVSYRVNSSGKITEIAFNAANQAGDPDDGLFLYDVLNEGAANDASEYNALNKVFGNNVGVANETIVFSLPINASSTEDDFSISSISAFTDEKKYDVAFMQVDPDTGDAGIIILTNDGQIAGSNDALAIATKVMTAKDSDGYDVVQITFLQNGEEKTLYTTNDLYTNARGMAKGDVFEYGVDAAGNIEAITFAGVNNDVLAPTYAEITGITNTDAVSYTTAFGYAGGYVTGKDASRRIQIKDEATLAADIQNNTNSAASRHSIADDANVYVIDLTKTNITPVVAAYGDIQTTYADPNGQISDSDRDTYVVLKYVKGVVTDVVVYKGFANAVSPVL